MSIASLQDPVTCANLVIPELRVSVECADPGIHSYRLYASLGGSGLSAGHMQCIGYGDGVDDAGIWDVTHLYHTFSPSKSAVVERFNRTLKHKLWTKFTEFQTRKWTELLPKVLDEYNHTKHRSIGMTPLEALSPEGTKILQDVAAAKSTPKPKKPKVQRMPRRK